MLVILWHSTVTEYCERVLPSSISSKNSIHLFLLIHLLLCPPFEVEATSFIHLSSSPWLLSVISQCFCDILSVFNRFLFQRLRPGTLITTILLPVTHFEHQYHQVCDSWQLWFQCHQHCHCHSQSLWLTICCSLQYYQ